MEQKIQKKLLDAIGEYQMLASVRGVLVGFSGGADSSALLRLMKDICIERGIHLAALHVHHGIRGEEADRDAEFCLAECEKLGIECKVARFDVPSLSEKLGKGLEETARLCRYEAFTEEVKAHPEFNCIATAHNADDNAETVIYSLARGCGADGLTGIPPVRYERGIRVIRPLILCTKEEIVKYLEGISAPFIFDSTNDDTAYRRNFIRHRIMPALRELNPAFSGAVARTGSLLREDAAFLDAEVERFLGEYAVGGEIPVKALSDAERAVASRAVIRLISALTDAMPERTHIEAVLALAKGGRNGSSVNICGGVRAEVFRGMLKFRKGGDTEAYDFTCPLDEGVNRFGKPDFAVELRYVENCPADLQKYNETLQNIYKLSIYTRLNSDKINGRLFVRSRRDGDAYVFGGMTRRLKKLFNDRKLPKEVRRALPVVCDGRGIVWVPGFPCADRVSPTGQSCISLVYYSDIGEEL